MEFGVHLPQMALAGDPTDCATIRSVASVRNEGTG